MQGLDVVKASWNRLVSSSELTVISREVSYYDLLLFGRHVPLKPSREI